MKRGFQRRLVEDTIQESAIVELTSENSHSLDELDHATTGSDQDENDRKHKYSSFVSKQTGLLYILYIFFDCVSNFFIFLILIHLKINFFCVVIVFIFAHR